MPSRLPLLALVAAASSLLACATDTASEPADGEETSALSEDSRPRAGSSIQSPSVSASKTYWGARGIRVLEFVGYLSADEAALARRADGILANSPPNDRIGVDELAELERRSATLFPQERAVIPKLWKILEQQAAPTEKASPPAIATTAASTYAAAPFKMPISSLEASLQQLAQRIQLTKNDDGNGQTISGADVAGAYADRPSYLPAEVAAFRTLALAITAGAPKIGNDASKLVVQTPSTAKQTLATVSGVEIVVNKTVEIRGTYTAGIPVAPQPQTSGSVPNLLGQASVTTTAAPAVTAQIIGLDPTSGTDRLYGIGDELTTGRVEVWSGGQRLKEILLVVEPAVLKEIPFGHTVELDGSPWRLLCDAGTCRYARDGQVAGTPPIPATSYFIEGRPGARLELRAAGWGVLVEGTTRKTCFPYNSAYGYRAPGSCAVYTSTGDIAETITYSVSSGALPFLATSYVGGVTAALYPY